MMIICNAEDGVERDFKFDKNIEAIAIICSPPPPGGHWIIKIIWDLTNVITNIITMYLTDSQQMMIIIMGVGEHWI